MKKIVLVLALLMSACATVYVPPVPQYNTPAKGKIGVYIDTSDTIKHSHIGTTIFNNFNSEYEYDWRMEDTIFELVKQELAKSNSAIEVVNLKQLDGVKYDGLNLVGISGKTWAFSEGSEEMRKSLVDNGVYAVISISETPTLALLNCGQYGCSEFYSQGQGLFTRSFLGMDSYHASASYDINIELLTTPVDISMLEDVRELLSFQNKNPKISGFHAPADFKNITEQEMLPVKANIEAYLQTVTQTARPYLIKPNAEALIN